MRSTRDLLSLVTIMFVVFAMPQMSDAAAAAAILAPVAAFVTAFTGLINLLCVAGVVYGALKTISQLWTNREEGNWVWYGLGTLATAAIAFVIVPLVIAPGIALGATAEVIQVMDGIF